jgi:hypothetical protein
MTKQGNIQVVRRIIQVTKEKQTTYKAISVKISKE